MDLLDRLLGHDHWATTTLLDISQRLRREQLDREFDIGHRTLRDTFDHVIFIIDAWTDEMLEAPAEISRDSSTVDVLRDRYERAHARFSALARQVRDEQRLDDTFIDESGAPMTFGGAILHVALHNAEHRSELLHILQRLDLPDLRELPEIDHGLWDFWRRGLYEG
jgi:uncharacterized damage-inducible protein DinB